MTSSARRGLGGLTPFWDEAAVSATEAADDFFLRFKAIWKQPAAASALTAVTPAGTSEANKYCERAEPRVPAAASRSDRSSWLGGNLPRAAPLRPGTRKGVKSGLLSMSLDFIRALVLRHLCGEAWAGRTEAAAAPASGLAVQAWASEHPLPEVP